MSDKRLDEIVDRLLAATPGPWIVTLGSGMMQCTAVQHENSETGEMIPVADCCADWMLDRLKGRDHVPTMNFIRSAPEDMRYLLRALAGERRRREVAEASADRIFHGMVDAFQDALASGCDTNGAYDCMVEAGERALGCPAEDGEEPPTGSPTPVGGSSVEAMANYLHDRESGRRDLNPRPPEPH